MSTEHDAGGVIPAGVIVSSVARPSAGPAGLIRPICLSIGHSSFKLLAMIAKHVRQGRSLIPIVDDKLP